MNRLFFVIVCLIARTLIAEEHPYLQESLFEFNVECLYAPPLFSPKENSTFLPQVPKVNLITGEYCEDACDLVVAGIEPISIRRFYNHFSGHNERIYGHWRINPETFMLFNFEATNGSQTFVAAGESNSGFFLYEQPVASGFTLDAAKNKAFTNASSVLTGQNHPLNTRVSYTKGHEARKEAHRFVDYYWWDGTIKDGTGTERVFKTAVDQWPQAGHAWPCYERKHKVSGEIEEWPLSFTPPYQTQITEERRPNGNIIRYTYEDWYASTRKFDHALPKIYVLRSITAYSKAGLLLGSVDVSYTGHSPFPDLQHIKLVDIVHFTGSDGREALYSQPQRVIKKRVAYDTILSQVTASGKPKETYNYHHYLNKKRDSYAAPPYLYQVCQPEGRCFETSYDGAGKVSTQSAPVGPNGEQCPVAHYNYQSDHTIVYDGENNKTLYRFNADKRITAVEKYQGEQLDSIDRSEWDPETGNLLKRRLEDATGTLFYGAEYIYDKNHNVIEERIEGSAPIFRTYSDDGFNLKLSESDRPGKETLFTYIPDTNLLTSEIVKIYGSIAKRTFHFYDPEISSICIKTIVDDGVNENPNDFTGVTFRHVTEVIPRRTLPCLGLPEEIREYAGEQLLKKVRYTYHPSGQIVTEEHYDAENQYCFTVYNEYDDQERLISTTDALGNTTSFSYDNNFNLISQLGPKPGQHKEWRYDCANRPIQECEWQSDGTVLISEQKYDKASRLIATIDPSGFETRYIYDALGRVTAIHYPDGAVEKKEYDIRGNVIQETDPNGHVTRKTYNLRGQPTATYHPDGTEEHFTYNNIGGTLASHVDIHGIKTLYTYDLFDAVICSERGSTITTATYSAFQLLSVTDPMGETTYFTYDLAGRKIGERKGDRQTRFTYNALGQLSQTQEGDSITHFSYDLKGQLLEKKIQDVFQENYTYDESGNKTTTKTCAGITSTTYNSRGVPIQIKDPLGNITEITYSYIDGFTKTLCDPKGVIKIVLHDSRGRPIDLQTKNRNGELIQQEERKYDLAGQQTHITQFIYEGTLLQKTITNTWDYGPKGRLERLLESGEKETRYLYDHLGRLSTLIKPDGSQIHRSYDNLSRLARYYGQGIDYIYTYDCKNRLVQVTDNIHNTTLTSTYDSYDNIVSEKLDSGIVIRREFDPYGRRKVLSLPDASSIIYTFRGPYIHTLSRNGLVHTYSKRNLSGRPTQITLANQESITIDYDPLLRWKSYKTPHFQADYLYDTVGNLTEYHYTDPLGSEEIPYCYDDLHQILSESDHAYTYDSLYNRKSKDEENYILNTLFQITNDGKQEYVYDKNGNLLSDSLHTYEYDLLDRLISVTTNGERTFYTYDAFNRRIAKNDELYIWDGQQEIGVMRNGKIQELRILGEGKGAEIGAAVLLELNGRPYIPIHDHRGSLVTLLPLKGTPLTYRYTAFGEELTSNTLSPWRFASKRHDPETDFIFFGRRYYHPILGRWITPDPQGFQDGPNLYAYVCNNPLFYCDPYGLLATSLAETRNIGDFCGFLWYNACKVVEAVGHHCIPMPGIRDVVEAAGRFGRGGALFVPRQSCCIYNTGGIEVKNRILIYQNGINTTYDAAKMHAHKISEANEGVQVILLYYSNHGISCQLIDAMAVKCGLETSYHKMCAAYYAQLIEANPALVIESYAHSLGGTNLNRTGQILKKQGNEEVCDHFKVGSYGSSTIISDDLFGKVENHVSKLDIVPLTSSWSYLKNVVGLESNVIFHNPNSKNPLREHLLGEDTYWQLIEKRGQKFAEEHLAK